MSEQRNLPQPDTGHQLVWLPADFGPVEPYAHRRGFWDRQDGVVGLDPVCPVGRALAAQSRRGRQRPKPFACQLLSLRHEYGP